MHPPHQRISHLKEINFSGKKSFKVSKLILPSLSLFMHNNLSQTLICSCPTLLHLFYVTGLQREPFNGPQPPPLPGVTSNVWRPRYCLPSFLQLFPFASDTFCSPPAPRFSLPPHTPKLMLSPFLYVPSFPSIVFHTNAAIYIVRRYMVAENAIMAKTRQFHLTGPRLSACLRPKPDYSSPPPRHAACAFLSLSVKLLKELIPPSLHPDPPSVTLLFY